MPHHVYRTATRLSIIPALVLSACGCSPNHNTATQPDTSQPAAPQPPEVTLVEHSDPQELFKLVLAEQEKYKRKIRKVRFVSRYEQRSVTTESNRVYMQDRTVIREGDKVWSEAIIHPHEFKGRITPGTHMYIVWDRRDMVLWINKSGSGHMFEYDSPESLAKDRRHSGDYLWAFPERKYGYGTGAALLVKVSTLDPERNPSRFEALRISDSDGRTLYTLKGWMRDSAKHPRPSWELTVDPAKNYMVTRGLRRNPDPGDSKGMEFVATLKEIAPGAWFPMEWESKNYGPADPTTGTQPVAMITKYTVTELNLNTEPGPDQFTWKSLNVPDGTDFMREDESGEIKMWKVVNGELKFIASAGKPVAAK